jgi:ribosomal protein S27E
MPDISVTCVACGRSTTVSEYAALEQLPCPGCGAPLAPPTATEPRAKPTIKRREPFKPDLAADPAAEGAATESGPKVVTARVRGDALVLRKRTLNVNHITWAAIIALGVPLALVRYRGLLPGAAEFLSSMGDAVGIWVFLAMHVWLVAECFQDDFLTGICAVLVPGFSFGYLFARSANALLRVTFCLFAIACGPESYAQAMEWAGTVFQTVNGWIAGHEYEAGVIQ